MPGANWALHLLCDLAQNQCGGSEIAQLDVPELARVGIAVDDTGEGHPLPAELDARFINMPLGGNCSFATLEPRQQRS